MRLVSALEAGRRDLLEATHDIPDAEASVRPQARSWTVLECVEHVILLEQRYVVWIENGEPILPQPNHEKELRLFGKVRSRLTKVECPDVFRPAGRFVTLHEAFAEFKIVRDGTVRLVADRGEALYSIAVQHPFFGKLNGMELVQFMDAHARRHADQIREIHEALSMLRRA